MAGNTPWTPGPWHMKSGEATGFKTHSGQPGVYANARETDDYFILQIAEMSTNAPEYERKFNALLVAAAPEMAEELAQALPVLEAALIQATLYGEAENADLAALHVRRVKALLSRIEGGEA